MTELGCLSRQGRISVDDEHALARDLQLARDEAADRPEADDDDVVGDTVEDAFHRSVLPMDHHGVAREDPGQRGDGVAADDDEREHRHDREALLLVGQRREVAEHRDQISRVPQRTERLLGWRVRRRIEERQRERAAEQRQEQHTERAPRPVSPCLHVQSTEPGFGDAIEGHGCAYFFSATAFARRVPVDPRRSCRSCSIAAAWYLRRIAAMSTERSGSRCSRSQSGHAMSRGVGTGWSYTLPSILTGVSVWTGLVRVLPFGATTRPERRRAAVRQADAVRFGANLNRTSGAAGACASTGPTMLRHWRIGAVVAAIMVGLVMVGLGLATASPSLAPRYWLWLVPVFGLLSVLTAWIGSPDRPKLGFRAVGRQLLHWLVIGGAVAFDFWLRGTGEEAGLAAGFDALLLLAVGCFLAGVHLEAIFALVGLLLTATLFVLAKADQYFWILFVVGLAILAVIAGIAWLGRRGQTTAS